MLVLGICRSSSAISALLLQENMYFAACFRYTIILYSFIQIRTEFPNLAVSGNIRQNFLQIIKRLSIMQKIFRVTFLSAERYRSAHSL